MESLIRANFAESIRVKEESLEKNIQTMQQAAQAVIDALKAGKKIFFFGNGGSAADSQHMAAEFIGRFQKERRALPAIALTTDTSILTALGNDYGYDVVFARQIEGLGQKGDVAVGISTSGNSANVIKALEKARAMGLTTIGMTGGDGGQMRGLCDIQLNVPSKKTARIQESHICMAHTICELAENAFAE